MGEIADMVLEGILCEQCGVYMDDGAPGYPRLCSSCSGVTKTRKKKKKKKKKPAQVETVK